MFKFCRSFDFEGAEGWRQYAANIEIPPGRDRESVLKKFKAKWYKREIVGPAPDLYHSQITWHATASENAYRHRKRPLVTCMYI